MEIEYKKLRMVILQRVCTNYRINLFTKLTHQKDCDIRLFIGDDVPNTKVKSAADLGKVRVQKLKTKFWNLGSHVFPWHNGLIHELRKFKPDVILCEAESHFLGYIAAIIYQKLFNRKVALMYWCYIALPGKIESQNSLKARLKKYFRKYFDAFVLYSSYGKQTLIDQGFSDEQIFIATNVGDTDRFLQQAEELVLTKEEAKVKLGLGTSFTILYVGTLDENKRPGIMLDLAARFNMENVNFVLLGSGSMLEQLRQRKTNEHLSNVFLPGRVATDLSLYYRAADVMLIPGRGGIIISEAMAFGLPVIVFEADGTEGDLIKDKVTGIHVAGNDINDFEDAIQFLMSNPDLTANMGSEGKELLKLKFSANNMKEQIIGAANFSYKRKNGNN